MPPMLYPEIQTVSLEITTDEADLFDYLEDKEILLLKDSAFQKLLKGDLCPDQASVKVTFKITSDPLGEATHEFSIPVEADESSSANKFKGVDINNNDSVAADGSSQ